MSGQAVIKLSFRLLVYVPCVTGAPPHPEYEFGKLFLSGSDDEKNAYAGGGWPRAGNTRASCGGVLNDDGG